MKAPSAGHAARYPSCLTPTRLLAALLVAGCANPAPPAGMTPTPRGRRPADDISLRPGWRATVLVQREDSIILTLPSGDRQLQRFDRRAGFTLAIGGDGKVSLRLDSLTVHPGDTGESQAPLGATWSEHASDVAVNAMRVTSGGDLAAALTAVVRNLLPRLPANGVHSLMTWADSASGNVRVDIFVASERRTASWSSGAVSGRGGSQVLPVRVCENFEQLGDGSQDGRKLSMTSQGRRSGTYYLTLDGRISSAQLEDSVAMLISIPATRQVVPTTQYARTTVLFISATHDQSD
ncbi:MAG: hypothetical protein ACRELE_07860 [Gemmatimonadales bacterium]